MKKPFPQVLAVAGFVLFACIGGYAIYAYTDDPFRAIQQFDADAYYESGSSLRGNVYRIDGSIQNSLGWSDAKGRLYTVMLPDREHAVIPVIFPPNLSSFNLQKGQKVIVKAVVVEDGFLSALEVKKP